MGNRNHAAIKRKVDDDLYHVLLENLFGALNAPNINMPPLHECAVLSGKEFRKLYHRIIYALIHDHPTLTPKINMMEFQIVKEVVNYHEVLGEINDKQPTDNFGNVRYIWDELNKLKIAQSQKSNEAWIRLYQSSLIFTSQSPIEFADAYFSLIAPRVQALLYCKIYNGLYDCYGEDQSIFEEVIGNEPALSYIHQSIRRS